MTVPVTGCVMCMSPHTAPPTVRPSQTKSTVARPVPDASVSGSAIATRLLPKVRRGVPARRRASTRSTVTFRS